MDRTMTPDQLDAQARELTTRAANMRRAEQLRQQAQALMQQADQLDPQASPEASPAQASQASPAEQLRPFEAACQRSLTDFWSANGMLQ